MKLKGDKHGQFYLIAAVVIIALIIGLVFVTNYSRQTGSVLVYDFAKELEIEAGKTFDLGAATGEYKWNDLTQNYSQYVGDDIQIVFIVGNPGNMEVYQYNQGVREDLSGYEDGENITVNVEDTDYKFRITEGQNFHFVMYQNFMDSRYVATN